MPPTLARGPSRRSGRASCPRLGQRQGLAHAPPWRSRGSPAVCRPRVRGQGRRELVCEAALVRAAKWPAGRTRWAALRRLGRPSAHFTSDIQLARRRCPSLRTRSSETAEAPPRWAPGRRRGRPAARASHSEAGLPSCGGGDGPRRRGAHAMEGGIFCTFRSSTCTDKHSIHLKNFFYIYFYPSKKMDGYLHLWLFAHLDICVCRSV